MVKVAGIQLVKSFHDTDDHLSCFVELKQTTRLKS
jgi:hypothetical protein